MRVAPGAGGAQPHVVVSAIEHDAVLAPAKRLEQMGFSVTRVQPDRNGFITVAALEQVMRPETVLVSVMAANSEVGSVQPVAELARTAHAAGALFRVNHRSWWKEELPSEDEYETARKTLNQAGWDVDYIITHCCPSSVQDTFSRGLYQRDALTDFFDEIRERCRFQYWFFGHYHENMVVEKEFVMLYNQIIRLK